MERIPMSSSVVVSAGYDGAQRRLEIEFSSGRIYQFEDVPEGVYQWLLRTPNKGSYVSRMINDKYVYRELTLKAQEPEVDLAEALRASLRELEGDS